MYALSNSRRPHEEDDADDRPQAPVRQPTQVRNQETKPQDDSPQVAGLAAKDDGEGAAAIMSARTKSFPENSHDDEEQVEDSYVEVSDKARKLKQDATAVGAVAVPGISAPNRPSISTDYEDAFEDSFTNRSPHSGEGQPVVPGQNEPIEARCVADDEADIEAQVQSRMKNEAKDIADMVHKQLMANAAVAEVQPSIQDTFSLTTTPSQDDRIRQKKKRKMLFLVAVGLLLIVATIAAGVGVAVSKKDDPVEQCSFCFDGSTPPNLDKNQVEGQLCATFRESQIKLDSTNPNCEYGQVVAWGRCECPTLPPPPENPKCTLCAADELPIGEGCVDYATSLVHLGQDPLYSCEDIAVMFTENGCTCPGESFNGNTIEAFQSVLESLSGGQLNDENSPQFKALTWIVNNDTANLSVGATPVETIRARYVAAVLYYGFGGDDWTEKYNFLSEGDICTWNQADFGIICGSDGSVDTLRLCKFRRVNPLTTLSYIFASQNNCCFYLHASDENNLAGTIPQEIGYLSGLTNVDMANNTIGGTLPNSLVNLTRLEYLNYTNNDLRGTLPEFLFTHLQLKNIILDSNSFNGTLSPSLGTSPKLEVLWLLNNSLTGTIPPTVGQSVVLGSLDLSGNSLEGSIPEFSTASSVWDLLLEGNSLTGFIPASIGNMSRLRFFSVGENSLINGTIPSELGQCQNLRYIYLSNNNMAGTLPTELGSLSFLETLFLDGNGFSGPIPAELGNCQNLIDLELYDNLLTGDIGPVIDSLPRGVQLLGLAVNKLQGTLPTSIGTLAYLHWLNLRSNSLNGTIPSELGLLRQLELLDLSSNKFNGTVPTSLANLSLLSK